MNCDTSVVQLLASLYTDWANWAHRHKPQYRRKNLKFQAGLKVYRL
jgi:hypothetical protein